MVLVDRKFPELNIFLEVIGILRLFRGILGHFRVLIEFHWMFVYWRRKRVY